MKDKEDWHSAVQGVTKSQTWLSSWTTTIYLYWYISLLLNYTCIYTCICIYTHRRRCWRPTPVLLPGKSHGRRSLVGCSPWGCEESYTTERLHFHFSLSCIGDGNVNPLQGSCLENPRDGGVWWAAVYGVSQSLTQLKRLSSSSSIYMSNLNSQFIPPTPSHPCPHFCSLRMRLCSFPGTRFICIMFLDSTYMH